MKRAWFLAVLAAATCGCGKKEEAPVKPALKQSITLAPASNDPRPAIVCFGDSITAGFGLDAGQSFPELLLLSPSSGIP